MNLKFKLTGLTALLMHQNDVESRDLLEAWRKDPEHKKSSKAGDDRSPAWTWQTYLYSDGQRVTIPSQNLMVAIRKAGAQIILKKQTTFKELSQSGMLITSEFLDFQAGTPLRPIAIRDITSIADKTFAEQSNATRDLGFRLFVKPSAVQSSSHVRVRPRFDQWQVTGEIITSVPELTQEIVKQLLDRAGRVGLCDWRPGCKTPGPFGMFKAEIL
jgi:hypothetical protein